MRRPAADEPADPVDAGPGRRGMATLRTAASVALGLALLGLLIYHADVDAIHEHMGELGWTAPLVLVPWLVIACVDAIGWRCTLPPEDARRIPFGSLVLVRMAGEAINSVTPTAAVGGEPVKAHLLRRWGIPGSQSLASIVIAKTALTVSQSLFIVIGVAALCVRWNRPGLGTALVLLLLAATAGFAALLMRLQRREPVTTVWRWLQRLVPRSRVLARFEASARAIDARLADFYGLERGAFWRASAWHLLGWLLGVTEVSLIMYLIGTPIDALDALLIESLSQPIRAAAVVIPGGLGTQEWGGVALCRLLGMPEHQAATLWLLKRGRELVFDGIGLLYLLHRSQRPSAA
ncbi:MAG TPA: flippase-like domain-containing protein [Gaiellaceae bacterium]|nr:flippase-like domain-containing protein [Gaiellaceae bacterium]